MERFYQKISPAFLKSWDHKLLIHYPWLWATRIHHVGFWLLVNLCLLSCFTWGQLHFFSKDIIAIENTIKIIDLYKFVGLGLWLWALGRNHWLETNFFLSSRQTFIRMAVSFLGVFLLSVLPFFYGVLLYCFGLPLDVLAESDFWPISWLSMLLFAPFWCLLFEIAAYVKKAEFLVIILGRILLMMLSFLVYNVLEWFDLGNTWGVLVYVLCEILLLLNFGYRRRKKRHTIDLQIVALAIVPIILSFVQFFWIGGALYMWFVEENPIELSNFYTIYSACIGFAFLTWHFFLRKRVMRLQIQARV